ncbi:MAG: hypothetical protein R3F39_16475 [Myxococcota bacterium]
MRFPTRHLLGVIVAAALAGGCRDAAPPQAPPAAPSTEGAAGQGGSPGATADAAPAASAPDAPPVAKVEAPADKVITPPPVAVEPNVAERPEAAEAEPAGQFDGHKLAILHTANMAGELEPCG